MQYLMKFKTLIGCFIESNWPRKILNWMFYWIKLAKNNFELNIESWRFFLIEYLFELNPDNFLLNQKLNWIIFEWNSIIDWIVKLYLPGLDGIGPEPSPITFLIHSGQEENNPSSLNASHRPFHSTLLFLFIAIHCIKWYVFMFL